MDNYLKIRNFGPVKDATVELKPFLVFIGGQGTGKSTIAKLLSIFQDKLWYMSILSEKNESSLEAFIKFGIHNYFNEDTCLEFMNEETHIVYDKKKFSLSYKGKSSPEELLPVFSSWFEDSTRKFAEISKSDLLDIQKLTMSQNEAEKDNQQPLQDQLKSYLQNYLEIQNRLNLIQSVFSNMGAKLYIPAERNLMASFAGTWANMKVAGLPLQDKLLNYISYFEKAKKEYPVYHIPSLGITYKCEGNNEGLLINGTDKLLPLTECSSGVQSLLPMLMVLDYCIDKSIYSGYVIEEPEQNLFPDNQLYTLRYIVSKNNVQGSSCIITTHSPYLLSAINISLLAGKIAGYEKYKDEVGNILPEEYHLRPGTVAAYALGDEKEYCRDIMNGNTNTIDQNYLDTTSSIIGQEFGKLYKLYVKSLKDNH